MDALYPVKINDIFSNPNSDSMFTIVFGNQEMEKEFIINVRPEIAMSLDQAKNQPVPKMEKENFRSRIISQLIKALPYQDREEFDQKVDNISLVFAYDPNEEQPVVAVQLLSEGRKEATLMMDTEEVGIGDIIIQFYVAGYPILASQGTFDIMGQDFFEKEGKINHDDTLKEALRLAISREDYRRAKEIKNKLE